MERAFSGTLGRSGKIMRSFARFAAVLLGLLVIAPRPLDATEKCYWVWTGRTIEFDMNTGAYEIVNYYRWFCDGQTTPP
jgi:hypothetical protein